MSPPEIEDEAWEDIPRCAMVCLSGRRWCWWVDYRPLPACPPHWFPPGLSFHSPSPHRVKGITLFILGGFSFEGKLPATIFFFFFILQAARTGLFNVGFWGRGAWGCSKPQVSRVAHSSSLSWEWRVGEVEILPATTDSEGSREIKMSPSSLMVLRFRNFPTDFFCCPAHETHSRTFVLFLDWLK